MRHEVVCAVISLIILACPNLSNAKENTAPTALPVQVMIVGVYHMSNPGHDLHDAKSDDVLQPKRQREIETLINSIDRFHPTKVGVEWDASVVTDRFPKYLDGTLPPSRNEVVQLGFRLAKQANASVYGIDADGDFPWDRLANYAKAYGFKDLIDNPNSGADAARLQDIIDNQGVVPALNYLNNPEHIKQDNSFYRSILKIGAGYDQPGADLLAAWQHRNLLICAHIMQIVKPGDRLVVFFGAGHAFLLRQCVQETPGMELVEPEKYLAR